MAMGDSSHAIPVQAAHAFFIASDNLYCNATHNKNCGQKVILLFAYHVIGGWDAFYADSNIPKVIRN